MQLKNHHKAKSCINIYLKTWHTMCANQFQTNMQDYYALTYQIIIKGFMYK